MSFSEFSTFSTPSFFGTKQNYHLTASRSADRALALKTKTMWTNGAIHYARVDSPGRREAIFFFFFFFLTPSFFGTKQNYHLTASRSADRALALKTKTMWTNGAIHYARVDSPGRREAIFFFFFFFFFFRPHRSLEQSKIITWRPPVALTEHLLWKRRQCEQTELFITQELILRDAVKQFFFFFFFFFLTPSFFGTKQNYHLTASRSADRALALKTKTMWTNGAIHYARVDSLGRREAIFFFFFFFFFAVPRIARVEK